MSTAGHRAVFKPGLPRLTTDCLDLPACSLAFDEALPGIVLRWKGYATSAELRAVHEHLPTLIQKHRISKILGDDTALASVASEDRHWILENWMPRAVSAGLRATAAKKEEQQLFRPAATEEIARESEPRLQIRFFDAVSEARAWLQTVPVHRS